MWESIMFGRLTKHRMKMKCNETPDKCGFSTKTGQGYMCKKVEKGNLYLCPNANEDGKTGA